MLPQPSRCSDITTSQSVIEKVVRLTNEITLQPGTKIELVCESRVKVKMMEPRVFLPGDHYKDSSKAFPYSLVSASTPITLVSENRRIRISSTAPLSEGFARGWRKLPDELKVEVLKSNLVQGWPIYYDIGQPLHQSMLSHHPALGPDFAHLAEQTFWQCNTVAIDLAVQLRPPITVRPHIRTLDISMYWPQGQYWKGLE
jgi:hypothetical protein